MLGRLLPLLQLPCHSEFGWSETAENTLFSTHTTSELKQITSQIHIKTSGRGIKEFPEERAEES